MFIYKFGNLLLNFIYLFFKLFPRNKRKVVFLSRQSNEVSLDYKMIINEIYKNYPNYKIVVMTNKLGKTLSEKIKYLKVMFIQMYHLSTSKTCVIDGYNITVSVLKHKKSLKIIQIWHSLGAIKKFGYQTLDKESGNSSKIAKAMRMHKNYDLIVSGSKAMIPYFSLAFNADESKFINCGLPRIDYLLKTEKENKRKILKMYPELKEKKVILYVPTFRKKEDYYINNLIECTDRSKYELIIKGHPLKKINNKKYSEFTSLDLLSVADFVITDYSGISIEAAALNKKIYFYLYDIEEYKEKVGLNIDLEKEMSSCSFRDAKDLICAIESGNYNYSELKKYRGKYIDNLDGNSTKIIVDYIVGEV